MAERRSLRFLSPSAPVRIGPSTARALPVGTWGGLPAARIGLQTDGPPDQLGRLGYHATTVLGGGVLPGTTAYVPSTSRLLSPQQCHDLYVRCPDVRSSIDSVVRRVATTDWDIVPLIDPSEAEYEAALLVCAEERDWFRIPTADRWVWQEVWTAILTDLLKWDAGVAELVPEFADDSGSILEIPPMRGADVHPRTTKDGRLQDYVQIPTVSLAAGQPIVLTANRVMYLSLFKNTDGPEGIPILESLIYEAIALLRSAEFVAASLNLNELPPGLLVVAGVAETAAQRLRADFRSRAGSAAEWELRMLSSPRAGAVDAKWVEFRKLPKELQTLELAGMLQRTVWRLFGVMPIEQGETDATPRATAEVQLDAGQSHLIQPILELTEAKINADILERRLDEKWRGRIAFRWKVERDQTAEEKKLQSEELGSYVDRAVLTRNEVRKIKGFPPHPLGDILTVRIPGGAIVSLENALAAPVVDPNAKEPDPFADDEEEDEDIEEEESDEGDDEDVAVAASRPRRRRARVAGPTPRGRDIPRPRSLRQPAERASSHVHVVRSSDDLPSDWQPAGRFKGTRTLDLVELWDEVTGYTRDVRPLWEEAREAAMSVVAAEYVVDGFDSDRRARVAQRISAEVDRLRERWSLSVAPRYERVALAARRQAGNWTSYASPVETIRTRAGIYRSMALGYLDAPGGLLSDLRTRVAEVLVAVSDARSIPDRRRLDPRAAPLSPTSSAAAVLAAIAGTFDALRHRIDNWSGKLVELGYDILTSEVLDGASTGAAGGIADPDPGDQGAVEWWCEWVSVGDEAQCETCRDLGGRGFMLLANLPTRPGGATRCRANCRCVLVVWTKAEIDGGRAVLMGGGNTGKTLSRGRRLGVRESQYIVDALDRTTVRTWLVEHYTDARKMPQPRVAALIAQWRSGHHRDLLEPPSWSRSALRGLQVRKAALATLLGDSGIALSELPPSGFVRLEGAASRALAATEASRDKSWSISVAAACSFAAGEFVDELADVDPSEAYAAVLLVQVGDRYGWLLDHRGTALEPGVGDVDFQGEQLADTIGREQEVLTSEDQQPYAIAYARRDALAEDPELLRNLVGNLKRG